MEYNGSMKKRKPTSAWKYQAKNSQRKRGFLSLQRMRGHYRQREWYLPKLGGTKEHCLLTYYEEIDIADG